MYILYFVCRRYCFATFQMKNKNTTPRRSQSRVFVFYCDCVLFTTCLLLNSHHAIQPFIYIPAAIDAFYIKEIYIQ